MNKHFLELIRHGIICFSRATRCKRGTIFLEFLSNHNIFSFLIYWIACLLVDSSLIGVGTLLLLTPQFLWRVGCWKELPTRCYETVQEPTCNHHTVSFEWNLHFFLPLNFICVHISTIISKYIRIEKDQDNKILFSVVTIPTREILHYFKILN